MIKQNISEIEQNIRKAKACSKYKQDVTLIAVSKTKPIPMLEEAYAYGLRDFGENKVQELVEKYEHLPKDIRWHMIGHLQTNKVKYIVDKVYLIHSVDSIKLANAISKEAQKKSVHVKIMIEVNVAGEDSKFGLENPDDVVEMIRQISVLPNIEIKGLMTVAPYTENPEENREYFAKLHQLAVDINNENIDNVSIDFLSMGMTGDYEVAIEEGATFVRVGTGIFGERNYGHVKGE